MSGIETLYIILFFVCILLSAFFSSSETAFISLQRIKLEHLVSTEIKGADRVARMMKRPDRFLPTVLLGNNLVNTAAAALATVLAISLWDEQGILIATIGVTFILLIFSETIPKAIAAHRAEGVCLAFVRTLEILSWLLTPFVVALSWIASTFSKLVAGTPAPAPLEADEEIRTMISVGHKEGAVEEAEAKLLDKVFEFGDRPVREVMVPRPEVISIEQGSKISDFLALYAQYPRSRFPVFQDNMDNVVGILAIKDVLMAQAKSNVNKQNAINDLIRPAYFTPETKHINELFAEMRDNNYRMAVVVDEFGGTAGIVMLSRLVEEIVGELGDELAAVEKEYEVINEYTFQIEGSMRIEEANEEMKLDLPEGDYETVAGFVLHLLGYIPEVNEQIRHEDMKIVVTEMRGQKIEKIELTREGHAAPAD